MPPKAKAAPKKRAPPKNAHVLAPKIADGTVFRDFIKGEWKVGKPIGSGGFGLIYLADRNSSKVVGPNADYVMKVEPHSNGPLFCELHFYQRAAKPDLIKEWMAKKKMKVLGMPKYVASGSCDVQGVKCRFMVMEKFGTDLQKNFESSHKKFPVGTVMSIGMKVLDTLEYIHDQNYAHADIKAANLLMADGKTSDQVYLVDFGLAFKYVSDGKHKEYKEDPKRCHDGTIEFTSIDAHKGVAPSRRADLEILGYCMTQWLCSKLPWEDKLENKEYVRDQKIKYMKDIPSFIKKCFSNTACPDELVKFLQYSQKLGYDEKPDYAKCKQFFKKAGGSDSGKLVFSAANGTSLKAKTPAKGRKRKSEPSEDEIESDSDDFASPPPKARATPAKKRAATPKVVKKRVAAEAEVSTPDLASPRARGGARPKTPASRLKSPAPRTPKVKASTAAKAKSPGADKGIMPKVTTAAEMRAKIAKKRKVDISTQTSPGLKGLKRSRRK